MPLDAKYFTRLLAGANGANEQHFEVLDPQIDNMHEFGPSLLNIQMNLWDLSLLTQTLTVTQTKILKSAFFHLLFYVKTFFHLLFYIKSTCKLKTQSGLAATEILRGIYALIG